MMKTLDRYVLREITVPFVVGMGLFFVVVAFGQVLKVSDSVTGMGVSGAEIIQALLYSFPPIMGILIPVSALFATLLGMGRLATDREIVGLCAAGVSPYRLLRVPLVAGTLLAMVAAYATCVGEPWGIRGLRSLMSRSAQKTLAQGVRIGEFNEWIPGVVLLARGEKKGRLQDVVFADRRDSTHPIVISARYGKVKTGEKSQDLVFELEEGSVLLETKDDASSRVVYFQQMLYRLDVGKLVGNKARVLSRAQEKGVLELWEAARKTKKESRRALYTVVLHRKAAIPLATIIFALLAVPLGCHRGGGARARGFLISTVLVGAYYYIGRAAELQARNGDFPAVLAAWLPDLLGVMALIVMLIRFRRSAT